MTTRIVGQNYQKNSNSTTSSRRNKDRKKDRDRDRDRDREKDRDSDREINSPNRKNINTKQSQNIHYEDFDYSSNNNNNNHHLNYNIDNIERNVDQSAERSNIKHSKGFILNKPYGVWPFHTNKEINSYSGNKTEPKYYLGNYCYLHSSY